MDILPPGTTNPLSKQNNWHHSFHKHKSKLKQGRAFIINWSSEVLFLILQPQGWYQRLFLQCRNFKLPVHQSAKPEHESRRALWSPAMHWLSSSDAQWSDSATRSKGAVMRRSIREPDDDTLWPPLRSSWAGGALVSNSSLTHHRFHSATSLRVLSWLAQFPRDWRAVRVEPDRFPR